VTDHGFSFGAHAEQYAIIGTLSQLKTSDNRDCDNCSPGFYSPMAVVPSPRNAEEIFTQLEQLGLKQRHLAEALGIEENKVSKVKSGQRQFKATELMAAMAFIEMRKAELQNVQEQAHLAYKHVRSNPVLNVPGDGEVVQIQKLDLSLSMGPGTLIDGYVESELVSFDLNFVRQFSRAPSDRLRIVTGVGDSMEPTLFRNDLIVIDTNDRMLTKQDGIYWINLYGAAGIKRLRAIGPKTILVKSDNPIHDDQEVDADDLRIEGRAIWTTRGL
jgi:phage repressor protein C with HTH and peptisase S24 domain